MIWVYFWDTMRSNLYVLKRDFVSKKMNYFVESYIRVLDDNLLEIYESDLIFMQDNVLIHTARKVRKWFEENDVVVMKWSLYSLDLNSIEHLWFKLKELVYQVNSHIENVKDDENVIRETLFKTLFEIWQLIDESILKELIDSMKRWVKAIIASDD